MAKKPIINPVSPGNNAAAINANLYRIQEAFDNTVSRDGSTPNHMLADFDMNSNDILNAGIIQTDRLLVRGEDYEVYVDEAKNQADRSRDEAERAEDYADEAQGSEVAAGVSAGEAADSADLAAALTAESPQSWAQFADFLDYADGKVVWYNGVQFVRDRSANIAGLGPGASWKPVGPPSPWHFNAVCDGVTDDTDALMLMHSYCNAIDTPPSYIGVDKFAIQADAQIQINTDVNFCGASISIIGGMDPSPSWSTDRNEAFVIEDSSRPLVTFTAPPSDPASLARGMRTAFRQFFQGPGLYYAFFNGASGPKISSRDNASGISFRQAFHILPDGTTSRPLTVDASGSDSIWGQYRLNSDRPLHVGNIKTDLAEYNNQSIFRVSRNQVTVWGLVTHAASKPQTSINTLVSPQYCSDFTFKDSFGVSSVNENSEGTYICCPNFVGGYRYSNLRFFGERAEGYWSSLASHYSSDAHISNCDVDRIDIHAYSTFLTVDNCDLRGRGISMGQGGGVLSVRGSRFHAYVGGMDSLVHSRTDYGGGWDGTVSVSDCNIITELFTVYGVNLTIGNTAIPQNAPTTVSVSNVDVSYARDTAFSGTSTFIPVSIVARSSASSVIAPAAVSVDGVRSSARTRSVCTIDLNSFMPPLRGSDLGCEVRLENIQNDLASLTTGGILTIPEAKTTPSKSAFKIDISITNCRNVAANVSEVLYNGCNITMIGCHIRRAVIPSQFATRYIGCEFNSPLLAGAETAAPVCNPFVSGPRYTTIIGGRVAGAFDLSPARAISALSSESSTSTGLVMPSGVTRAQLFTGWIAS